MWTFCGVETDDTMETFTFDVSLPSHAQRLQICAAELSGASIGQFGCLALLSLDPGGEFGWTINGGNWAARGG
jgi:hypothetical protein